MTNVQETILNEYEDYLKKTIRKRVTEFIDLAGDILKYIHETLSEKKSLQEKNITDVFGTNKWKLHKVNKFIFFLKVKGILSNEKGYKLNQNNVKTIDSYFNDFMLYAKAEGKAEGTIKTYTAYFNQFKLYCSKTGMVSLNQFTVRSIENYKEFLYSSKYNKKKQYSNLAQIHSLQFVKMYFNWLYRQNYITYDPAKKVKCQIKHKTMHLNFLRQKDMEKVLKSINLRTIHDKKNSIAVYISYFTD